MDITRCKQFMKDLYYKYLPIERISYLENQTLRFTQPSDLNDPFECLPQRPSDKEMENMVKTIQELLFQKAKSQAEIDFYSTKVEELKSNLDNKKKGNLLDMLYYEAYENINKEIGILSLSKNWNNTLMWAHYTKSHSGFCVGFDPKHKYFENYLSEDKNSSKTTKEVDYSKERLKIPMKLNQKPIELEPFFTKSEDWSYEEEIRMVATLNLAKTKEQKNCTDIYLFEVPYDAIKEIIVGVNIDKSKSQILNDFAKERNIDFFKSEISETKFNMKRV